MRLKAAGSRPTHRLVECSCYDLVYLRSSPLFLAGHRIRAWNIHFRFAACIKPGEHFFEATVCILRHIGMWFDHADVSLRFFHAQGSYLFLCLFINTVANTVMACDDENVSELANGQDKQAVLGYRGIQLELLSQIVLLIKMAENFTVVHLTLVVVSGERQATDHASLRVDARHQLDTRDQS